MHTRTIHLCGALLVGVIVATAAAPALADEEIQEGKQYRLILTNNKEIVGTLTETEHTYKVQVASGITQTIRKSQVRSLILLEAEQATGGDSSALRHPLTDGEISQILGDESAEDLYVWDYVKPVDLMEPLELNRESLDEMKRFAGREANWLDTEHFVCVYTSDHKAARTLVSRLEIVYKWNATFARLFEVPTRRPEHKLEIFYFGTYKEFGTYATLCGWTGQGAAGFYMRDNNRCAFFDNSTYPQIELRLKAMKEANVPYERRRKLQNEIDRWANFIDLEVVQHEATHAIHFNIGIFPAEARIGKWMTEGLCVQFEVPPTQEGGSFGALNYARLDSFHKMYMAGPPGNERVAAPWTFVKNMVLSPGTGLHDYVMGWALNYYLRKQFKEEYGQWMRTLAAQEDDWFAQISLTQRLAQFEEIFGKLDEEWVQEFYDYIAAIPIKKSAIVEFPEDFP